MGAETLVIIPTYNERENLPQILQRLLALPVNVDVLVVDDNSPDGTGKVADEFASRNPAVHVLHRKIKDGLGLIAFGAYSIAELRYGRDPRVKVERAIERNAA